MQSMRSKRSRWAWRKPKPSRSSRRRLARELSVFLHRTGYPFADEWTTKYLARCEMRLGLKDGSPAAAVWLSPLFDGLWEVHVCAAPGARADWLLSALADPQSLGYGDLPVKGLVARPIDPRHARLAQRLGFCDFGDFHMILIH